MCLRPDVVFVTSQAVFDDYQALSDRGLYGVTNGYHRHCEAQISAALKRGDAAAASHWRLVQDFGHRYDCSPLGGVEIAGVLHRDPALPPCPPEARVRLYIGNPDNPPHENHQPAVTKSSMARVNAGYVPIA